MSQEEFEYEAPAAREAGEPRRAVPLYAKILIALVIGGVIGLAINVLNRPVEGVKPYPQIDTAIDNVIEPIGKIFLRLVLMVVIPLVFSALTRSSLPISESPVSPQSVPRWCWSELVGAGRCSVSARSSVRSR